MLDNKLDARLTVCTEGLPHRHRVVRAGFRCVGFAPDAALLTLMRVLQGQRGSPHPGSLAILEASFTSADRARAAGVRSWLGGVAVAAGPPPLGGYLYLGGVMG
jgi:hypothetical protein